jgi:hypothetical protein
MIEAKRLLEDLSPQGFQLAWEYWIGRQLHCDFVRPSMVDGVFEHIAIDGSGSRGEAVTCTVWVSPVRGHRLHFKPAPEVDEVLVELGNSAPGRAFTEIETPSEATAWELRVAEVAPERVRSLAQKHAREIAIQTSAARKSAMEYVRRIRAMSDDPVMEYLAYQLSCRATPTQLQQAGEWNPGGVWDEVQDACRCAAIAVSMFGLEIDAEHGGFVDEPASKSCELKLRLNIAADMLRCGKGPAVL